MKRNTKAPVLVVMPEIKLTVSDLAFMTGLMPGATRCHGGVKVTDKLVFLGLIEMAEVPVCPKALAKFERERDEWKSGVRIAMKIGTLDNIIDRGIPYNIQEGRRPKQGRDWMLTKSGFEFMAKGRTTSVTSIKAGCIK